MPLEESKPPVPDTSKAKAPNKDASEREPDEDKLQANLTRLKKLHDLELIDDEEYKTLKLKLLSSLST